MTMSQFFTVAVGLLIAMSAGLKFGVEAGREQGAATALNDLYKYELSLKIDNGKIRIEKFRDEPECEDYRVRWLKKFGEHSGRYEIFTCKPIGGA